MQLEALLASAGDDRSGRLTLFAIIALGVIEALAGDSLSATAALTAFFTADNCLYVRKSLKAKLAHRVMGHGVQFADLFGALPTEEAQREYLHELAAMKSLCARLIEGRRVVA